MSLFKKEWRDAQMLQGGEQNRSFLPFLDLFLTN